MKRLLLLTCLTFISAMLCRADIVCTGTVVDQSGEPLIGATVRVKGTAIAVAADIDGNFTI